MTTQTQLLKKYGIPVRGNSGQHLLIDPNIQEKIVDALNPSPKDKILEIGPGLGALTHLILKKGSRVWAVEKDERFVHILEGEYGRDYRDHLKVIHEDALKLKFEKLKAKPSTAKWKLVSNLPYYVTAPILFHVFESWKLFSKAILMMQQEVAKRLIATPGTKDYGRLSLAAKFYADTRILFNVSPGCFSPKPQVQSSVVELDFHPESKLPEGLDRETIFKLIKVAFSQRRKTLLHLLSDNPEIGKSKESLKAIFQNIDFSEKVRGEELLLKDYFKLAGALTGAIERPPR